MKTTMTLDKAGRAVLPKRVRDELQLGPGDALEVESSDDQIILRPLRAILPLYKKQGIWVLRAGKPISVETVNETLRKVREEKGRRSLGKAR
jgi:AbrB family looped-hinge helix DNA binding protein